jgi:hypothetical protein
VIEFLFDWFPKRHLLATEDIDCEILQDDRETDCADQRRQRAILGDRPNRDINRDDAEHGADDHGTQQGDIDVRTAVDHQIEPGEGAKPWNTSPCAK